MIRTGWLIEKVTNGGPPVWLCVQNGHFTWTAESTLAMWFVRREDALQLCEHYCFLPYNEISVTEHQWG